MARPKSTGEIKSHQQHLLMAKSEVAEVDEWMFRNRIRSRGDAIRRLCKIGIATEQSLSRIVGELKLIYFSLEEADEAFHKGEYSDDGERTRDYVRRTREIGDKLYMLMSGVSILAASFVPLRSSTKETTAALSEGEIIAEDIDYLNTLVGIKSGFIDASSSRSRELGRQAARRFLRFPIGGLVDNPFPPTDERHAIFVAGYQEVIAAAEELPTWVEEPKE